MKMYDEKPSYRELAIQHLKDNTLCRGYIDYLVGEMNKLEEIKKVINEVKNTKYDFGNEESTNAFCCGLYAGGFSKISSIVNSDK